MRRTLERLDRWLERRGSGLILLAAIAVIYAVAYVTHPLFPGHADGVARGWWTWTDQQRYREESAAIAGLGLNATTFHYPVGYPALGALFARVMPANLFLVPDLGLILGATVMWWRLARRLTTASTALVVAAAFLATHRALLADTEVVPWNTIATQLTLLAGILITVTRTEGRAVTWLAGLAAATYLVRPIDAVPFAPLLLFAVLRLPTGRERMGRGLIGVVMIAATVAAAAWLNHAIFGQWRSPYEVVSTQVVGFFSYPASYKFFWLFVDGRPLFGEMEPALLWRFPWMFLAIPGAIWWVTRERWAGAASLLAVGLSAALYLNYNDFLPSDIYRFNLIHYLVWWFPLMFVAAVSACVDGWRNRSVRIGFVGAAAAGLFCVGIQMEERPLPVVAVAGASGAWRLPAQRPLLLHFAGAPLGDVAQLRIAGRPMQEYSDYVAPYVPTDLRVLIGTKTEGTELTIAADARLEARPEIGEFHWRWWPKTGRIRQIFR